MVGVVLEVSAASEVPPEKLQAVEEVLDDGEALLDKEILGLLRWCWQYYKRAPGDVVCSALPPALRSSKGVLPEPPVHYRLTGAGKDRLERPPGRAKIPFSMLQAIAGGATAPEALVGIGSRWRKTLGGLLEQGHVEPVPAPDDLPDSSPGPVLLPDQADAVNAIASGLGRFRSHLLDGVTGSGKTEVYICLLEKVLSEGGQALVLVPEIGLTPQLLRRFSQRLGIEPAVIHSSLSAGERLRSWDAARTGRAPLLVGTRSALFTPMPRLKLIILDEEHDASFKQQEGFRYSARDVAVKRAAELGIPVVLGSATPSLESLRNARQGSYSCNKLRERATRA